MKNYSDKEITDVLLEQLNAEFMHHDRSGIYGYTQKTLAYNSNRIEGSRLTENQTAMLFDTGQIFVSENCSYRNKDLEEADGHFLMFNRMLQTLDQPLSEDLIKSFHYELKSGVFEDRANGYAVGEYKTRRNIVGVDRTTDPQNVSTNMEKLLHWYQAQNKNLDTLAEFHCRYECIHPFQDGNGRTGRIILFRECLVNGEVPFLIEDQNRAEYVNAFQTYRGTEDTSFMINLFRKEQNIYREHVLYFCEDLIRKKEKDSQLG